MTRSMFPASSPYAAEPSSPVGGVPPYRGLPMALRRHILEKLAMVEVLEDCADRIRVRWPAFRHVHAWTRVPGTEWFELTHTEQEP